MNIVKLNKKILRYILIVIFVTFIIIQFIGCCIIGFAIGNSEDKSELDE